MERLPETQLLTSLHGLTGPIVLAIGTFDGVHLGHQAVLHELLALSEKYAARPVAFFFEPPPRQVLHPEAPLHLLTATAEKLRIMADMGIRTAVRMPFTKDLSCMSPEDFLHTHLFGLPGIQIRGICVGDDFHFGSQNAGDVTALREFAASRDVEVCAVPPVLLDGLRISSSRIRKAVAAGDLRLAQRLLGRPYLLCGTVVHGNAIASQRLGCPTANLVDESLQMPPYGVYAARARIQDAPPMPGIVYIGDAPTIRGKDNGHPVMELHLFGQPGALYDKELSIEPVGFLRESILFPTPEALAAQIRSDIRKARELLSLPPGDTETPSRPPA